jgi:hypothetical protein
VSFSFGAEPTDAHSHLGHAWPDALTRRHARHDLDSEYDGISQTR